MQWPTIITRTVVLVSVQLAVACITASAQYQGGVWRPAAGPYGGNITALLAASDNSLIAGTPGGIYRSTNNGESWSNLAGNMPSIPVKGLARDSTGVLYAATTFGVYRSYDNGWGWKLLESDVPLTDVHSIAIYGREDVIVGGTGAMYLLRNGPIGDIWWQPYYYASISQNTIITVLATHAQNGIIYIGTSQDGLFRSTDAGQTAARVLALPCDTIHSIDMRSLESGGTALSVGTSCGLFRWSSQVPEWSEYPGPLSGRPVGAVKSIGNALYAGTLGFGIFRTTDWKNWTEVYNGIENPTIHSIEGLADGTIFCGTLHGVQRSTNMGERWDASSNGIRATNIRSLVVNSKGYLFACTETGVYRSMDKGAHWQEKNYLLYERDVQSLALDQQGILWAGTRQGRLFRSTDDGDTWSDELFVSKRPIEFIFFDSFIRMFVGTSGHEGGLYRSQDRGVTWRTDLAGQMKAFARSSRLYALTSDRGLFYSSNLGSTWINTLNDQNHSELAVHIGTVVVAGGEWVNVSTNGGTNWMKRNPPPCASVTAVMIDAEGTIIIGTACGAFRSTNNGFDWLEDRNGIEVRQITSFAQHVDNILFAGTEGAGIYMRDNTPAAVPEDNTKGDASDGIIVEQVQSGKCLLTLHHPGRYLVTLYDPLGRQLEIVADAVFDIGSHRLEASFDGLASGVYLLQVRGGGGVATAKLVVER